MKSIGDVLTDGEIPTMAADIEMDTETMVKGIP
jgi:hypothetical protein